MLAGGQGTLTGKIFRVGHLGSVSVDDIVAALEILEEALVALGIPVQRGGRRGRRRRGGRRQCRRGARPVPPRRPERGGRR